MKKIRLTQKKYALVNEIDYQELNKYKWCAARDYNTFYAVRTAIIDNKRTTIRMHREILKVHSNQYIDHKNGNGLDNRRENLRLASCSQNGANQKKHDRGISKFKGVCWHKLARKWVAQIRAHGKVNHLGYFNVESEAAIAYNKAALEYFGEFAKVNIIF